MRRWTASVLIWLFCSAALLAQEEVVVTWTPHPDTSPPLSFVQFIGLETPAETANPVAQWAGWDAGERLRTESNRETLRAMMWRQPRSWTLVLWNGSTQKVAVTIQGELPAGVYTVERLLLGRGGTPIALERRNGLLQRASGQVRRAEWIGAESGMVLRWVERGQAVDETLSALRRSIWGSEVSRGVLSRLTALWRETGSHWYQVRANLRRGDLRISARGIHRMLFLASGMRAASSKYPGAEQVTAQAEQLIDALSELSSALLNLVIRVEQEGRQVKVQIVNAGAQVWKALRLSSPALAADADVVLAEVKPLERAEALFSLPEGSTGAVVVASILFNGGYSRLRVALIPSEPVQREEETP